jgi:hypothetical protein
LAINVSVEPRGGEYRQRSSDAIVSRISNARHSGLESMLCGAFLRKSPLFAMLFAKLASHESSEAVFNPVSTK